MAALTSYVNGKQLPCDDVEASLLNPTLLNLVPPLRFAMVEEGVYRGAYPTLRNFPFLRGLGLRTIVSLIPEEPTYDLTRFAAAENITVRHIRAERYKGDVQLLPTEMSEVLQLLINVELHPLYIHCLDGRHVVGLVIMGLRKLQFWEVNCSHLEYQRFTRSVQDEVAFIVDYSGPIVVPMRIPSWLWKGTYCDASGKPKRIHVGIRLKFLSPPRTAEGGDGSPADPSKGGDHVSKTNANANVGNLTLEQLTIPMRSGDTASVSPMNTVADTTNNAGDGTESGLVYVDLPSITPAQLIGSANSKRHVACAIQTEKPLAADLRFLSLRASAGTPSGPSPPPRPPSAARDWEVWEALASVGVAPRGGSSAAAGISRVPSFITATGSEWSGMGRSTTRCGTSSVTGVGPWEVEDDSSSHHLLTHSMLHGVGNTPLPRWNEGNTSSASSTKCSSRSHRYLQYFVAEAAGSVPSTESGGGAKRTRRRKSL